MDVAATAQHAVIEDLSRRTAELVLIFASVISLIGVGLSLLESSDTGGLAKATMVRVASASVILSWATVHTVFTLRYARLFTPAEVASTSTRTARPATGTSRTSRSPSG